MTARVGGARGAGRLLHGRLAHPGRRAAPARAGRGARAARDALGLPRRPTASEAIRLGASCPPFEPLLARTGTLPIDALQALFACGRARLVAAKFRKFARLDQSSAASARGLRRARGLAQRRRPARRPGRARVPGGWYGGTSRARRMAHRRPAGRPGGHALPAFVAVPARDRIVPPESAAAAGSLIPRRRPAPPGGRPYRHDDRAAGRASALWRPLLDWLRGLPGLLT